MVPIMSRKSKTKKELELETKSLRERIEVAESTLHAIRDGSVDAFVVSKL
jgi:DNA-binding Xre family transcriptional regulator